MTTATTERTDTPDRAAVVEQALAIMFGVDRETDPAEVYSEEFRWHAPGREGDLDSVGRICAPFFEAFSEPRLEVERTEVVGDRAVTRVRFEGVHTGEFEGQAPTGRRARVEALLVHLLDGRRVSEAWGTLRWA